MFLLKNQAVLCWCETLHLWPTHRCFWDGWT